MSSLPDLHLPAVDERRLTVEEAAELARCSTKTVRRAISAGHLTAFRLTSGRGARAALRLRRQDVLAWLDGEPVVPAVGPPTPTDLLDVQIRPARPTRRT